MSGILGAGTELYFGTTDLADSANKTREAKSAHPPLEDTEMRQYLGYLERKRRAIATGADYDRDLAKLGGQLANTQTGIVQASGGAGGAGISGLLQAQRGAGDAFGTMVEKGRGEGLAYEGLVNQTLGSISKRKEELQLMDYNQLMAEAAALKKAGDEEFRAGASDIASMGDMAISGMG